MRKIQIPTEPTLIKKEEENSAVIEIGSLYPGYGITIGNALRRVLLSSLPGAAVTSVKITGADHEFSAFPGVKEDVIHILLNLKQIRFRLHTEEPATITLKAKGEREVHAGDFEVPSSVEIVNPELLIATLTDKKTVFEVEAEVSPGLGYESVEARQKDKLPIGSIALDAVYSPIRKANYTVENMRVGERTDFNKLIFEVETDGSVSPEKAFLESVRMLSDHIAVLAALPAGEEEPVAEVSTAKRSRRKKEETPEAKEE
jgi:DNA-directed RNA polymerase subunit alpha